MPMRSEATAVKGPELARELFLANYNCAQATLGGVLCGMGRSYKERIKSAGAFGAGIAQQGLTCGAVTGALMAFGLLIPQTGSIGAWKQEVADISKEFIKAFEDKFGKLDCNCLAGCDMTDAAVRKTFHDEGGRDRICTPMVEWGAGKAIELLRRR